MNFNFDVFRIYMRRIFKKKNIERKKTRQEKRNYKVIYKGKVFTAMNYINELAADLPTFYSKLTHKPVDHANRMRAMYMKSGNLDDINIYHERVVKAAKKQLKRRKNERNQY